MHLEWKIRIASLTETKLKGNGEVSWCEVNGIITGIPEMKRARKGVAVLLNDVWHRVVIDFECISSRILWIKFKFSRVKVCVRVGYGPNEGVAEERESFWNNMDRTVHRVGNGYRL